MYTKYRLFIMYEGLSNNFIGQNHNAFRLQGQFNRRIRSFSLFFINENLKLKHVLLHFLYKAHKIGMSPI